MIFRSILNRLNCAAKSATHLNEFYLCPCPYLWMYDMYYVLINQLRFYHLDFGKRNAVRDFNHANTDGTICGPIENILPPTLVKYYMFFLFCLTAASCTFGLVLEISHKISIKRNILDVFNSLSFFYRIQYSILYA